MEITTLNPTPSKHEYSAAARPAQESPRAWRDRVAPYVVGESPALLAVLDILSRAADSECNVLITGESGTGKELAARAIHDGSPRRAARFVALNCAAIPSELMEAELFGHAKGAFTGAVERREGRLAAAEGGTLFLDEIGDMDVRLQAKLLRVLQEREYTPVGDSAPRKANVRIVAATNQDLARACDEGRFREDLFYRLNVVPVELPSLAQRCEDVPRLAHYFVERACARHDKVLTGFAESAMSALMTHPWPGNIRELYNVIERAVVLKASEGPVVASDLVGLAGAKLPLTLPASLDAPVLPDQGLDLRRVLERIEVELTRQALAKSNGSKARAAELLGLKRTTLVERLKRLDLEAA